MTFLDIQDQVLDWLDDPRASYFTRPIIRKWINNAQTEAQKQLLDANENWYVRCSTTTLVQNQSCYVLPEGFLKLHHLEVVTDNTGNTQPLVLKHSTQGEADAFRGSQWGPSTFFLEKNCLILRGTPQNVYPLRMHWSRLVSPMTLDSEIPDVPPQYHEYLAVLATMDGKVKDDRDMTNILKKHEYYTQMMTVDKKQRLQDRPRRVVRTEDGSGFGGYGGW